MAIVHVRDNVYDTDVGRVVLALGSFDDSNVEEKILEVLNSARLASDEPRATAYTADEL